MVEFEDGNMLAQLGPPDMRFPIQYALHYPNRQACSLQGFDPKLFSTLTLEQVDESRYPAISLAKEALHAGSAAGTAINAADEIAVEAFLTGIISFAEIVPICQSTLRAMPAFEVNSIEEMTVVDGWAREYATAQLTSQAPA
jgi:1-deoxy-D-xylulose-5-phosphate reductoisomerase